MGRGVSLGLLLLWMVLESKSRFLLFPAFFLIFFDAILIFLLAQEIRFIFTHIANDSLIFKHQTILISVRYAVVESLINIVFIG